MEAKCKWAYVLQQARPLRGLQVPELLYSTQDDTVVA
jgi:hypothetical protein